MVKKGIVLTPHADYCLPGITRATVSIIIFQVINETLVNCLACISSNISY
jgi:hypothetical protein